MNGNRDIFKDFCRYVDEHIFSKENMGSYVAFIVDQAFIDDFSRENRTNEEELMCSLRVHMWGCNHKDHLFSKGMAAIQLYATTKRADSDGLTTKAYRGRLSQVIGVDIKSIQKWMSIYQDAIWHTIYIWCDKNSFKITKTQRRSRSYCYVQYPLAQALKVFTDEDLLYIAKCFVDYNLYPGEDIIERDFWKIIPKYSLFKFLK